MSFHAFGQCFQPFIDTALQKPENMLMSYLLETGHKVQGGGLAEIGGGSSIFKLTKRGGSPKYWSCV